MSLIADVFIDMNTGDANGTVLDPTILANGTIGTFAPPWIRAPVPPTGFTIDAHAASRTLLDEVVVGSTHYPTSHTSRPMRLLHTATPNTTVQIWFASTNRLCTVAGYITFGPANVGAGATLFDYVGIFSEVGDYAMLQLANGNGGVGTGYDVTIESNPLGVTTHSAYAQITPGATYWFSLHADFSAGTCSLKMYDSTTALVVNLTGTTGNGGNFINVTIGNNEAGTDSATVSYFENLLVDYTTALDPLGPGSPTLSAFLGEPVVGSSVF